jgi:DNA-binding NarL/FixJ family response regulator
MNMTTVNLRILFFVLVGIIVLIVSDILGDVRGGSSIFHLVIESCLAVASGMGVLLVLRHSFETKVKLRSARADLQKTREESLRWKQESEKYILGLSQSIDQQLSRWGLTPSEKEIALLLLKGLSLKEVAEVRQTSEKTCRVQSAAIYQKSGLAGRSELSAFFMEDLLSPIIQK